MDNQQVPNKTLSKNERFENGMILFAYILITFVSGLGLTKLLTIFKPLHYENSLGPGFFVFLMAPIINLLIILLVSLVQWKRKTKTIILIGSYLLLMVWLTAIILY